MPKVIQPRRHDKDLSAEEFWRIREQGKVTAQTQKLPPVVHKEEEVARRHRYIRPSEQAKSFNPLALLLRREQAVRQGDMGKYLKGEIEDKSHIEEYLENAQYTVSYELKGIKEWALGLKSIRHHIGKIYDLLWGHLELEETWALLQVAIQDAGSLKFDKWIHEGLLKFGEAIKEQAGQQFDQILFRNLFDTLCLLMQNAYEEVTSDMQSFHDAFTNAFLTHTNKYVRRFSMQSYCYLLRNLSPQTYQSFMPYLLSQLGKKELAKDVSIAQLLQNSLQVVRGCLTTTSLGQLLQMIPDIEKALESVDEFTDVVSELVKVSLLGLNPKQGRQDGQILFDINFVIRALIKQCDKNPVKYTPCILQGFAAYVSTYLSDRRLFTPATTHQTAYLNDMWGLLTDFVRESIKNHPLESKQMRDGLAVLALKSASKLYLDQSVVKYYETRPQAVEKLIKVAYKEESIDEQLTQVIVLVSKDILRTFLLGEGSDHIQTIYELILLIKSVDLGRKLQLDWLQISEKQVTQLIEKISSNQLSSNKTDSLVVLLRLLTLIQLPQQGVWLKALQSSKQKHLNKYSKWLHQNLNQSVKVKQQQKDYFTWRYYSEQLIVYSHHQLPWLSRAFTLYESFSLLTLSHQSKVQATLWNRLIMNRPSAVKIFTSQRQFQNSQSKDLLYRLISSRNRQVRYMALPLIRQHFTNEISLSLIDSISNVDSDVIDLENQREVKRVLSNIQQQLEIIPAEEQPQLVEMILRWSLGFAFTGFKLIGDAFISLLSKTLSIETQVEGKQVSQTVVMPFLEYYTYRHSRQFEHDTTDHTASHLTNAFPSFESQVNNYIARDMELEQAETVEWIGVQRVAEAIRRSVKAKRLLGQRLVDLTQAYFELQFHRQTTLISGVQPGEQSPPEKLLLPIKERFLLVMLRICPESVMPPLECLHHTRQYFFEHPLVRQIKRNNWQSIWESGQDKKKKKKNGVVAEIKTTAVNLEHMSQKEQEMYVHYLWKDIIEGNRHKKRIIMDHLRNYLPSAVQSLIDLLLKSMGVKVGEQTEEVLRQMQLMNRKVVLNLMFICKAALLHLKQQVRKQNNLQKIMQVVQAVIRLVHQRSEMQSEEQENAYQQPQNDNEDQDEEQEEEDPKRGQLADKYKQHRKQLHKFMHVLLQHHSFSSHAVRSLLTTLLTHSRIRLQSSTRSSTPGVLQTLLDISQQPSHLLVLIETEGGRVMQMMAEMMHKDVNGLRPNRQCYRLWAEFMNNVLNLQSNKVKMVDQEDQVPLNQSQVSRMDIEQVLQPHIPQLLACILSYIGAKDPSSPAPINRRQSSHAFQQDHMSQLRITHALMSLQKSSALPVEWQAVLWSELNAIARIKKNLTPAHCQSLSLLIGMVGYYLDCNPNTSTPFLQKITNLLPCFKDLTQRSNIASLISKHYKQLGLGQEVVKLVEGLSHTTQTGLVIEMDFGSFFGAATRYNALQTSALSTAEEEYFLYHLLCFVDNADLSVRRAVGGSLKAFLNRIKPSSQNNILLVVKIFRYVLQQMGKSSITEQQAVYWSIVEQAGVFFSWLASKEAQIFQIYPKSNIKLYQPIAPQMQGDNYFIQLTALAQTHKLRGLKMIRQQIQSLLPETKSLLKEWNTDTDMDLPNPIARIFLPVLEFLVTMVPQRQSNMGSSLALVSLELVPIAVSCLREGLVRKQLKKLGTKLKFSEGENKKNMAVIRLMGQIVEGLQGQKTNEKFKQIIVEQGFEEFNNKITNITRGVHRNTQDDESEYEADVSIRNKDKPAGYFENLEELEEEEAVNRNFMRFDRKMMDLEDDNPGANRHQMHDFLRKHMLLPLRTMLMMENRSSGKDEQSKSRLLLAVTVTKVLLRLPLDTFIKEFKKVVSRLGRLLKKKQWQVRQNARNCLCEMAKTVGPQLLYAIVMELKFHLRDNFDKHVLNYTLYRLLDSLELEWGQLDYCLPLVLPAVIDEVFGQSAEEKQMVAKGEVPTLKQEAKKRKGLDLLQLLCRHVSHTRLGFIIQFLEGYLREHLTSQVNLGKYDQMLGCINAGLTHNHSLLQLTHAHVLLETMHNPVSRLQSQLANIDWGTQRHDTTVSGKWVRHKATKGEVLMLQEEAGRNRSIFKKMAADVSLRRNEEIIASSLVQFYLVLLSLFVRKQVLHMGTAVESPIAGSQMLGLLSFLSECLSHRDNRLVAKSIKTLHLALSWRGEWPDSVLQSQWKTIRKNTSRRVLVLIEELTLSDEELLKECFVFLNDLISEESITHQMLPQLVAIIKLHTPSTDDQPHLPETYQLLRTILYKCPNQLHDPLLRDLHQMARSQLVTTRNSQIRALAKNITGVYLRTQEEMLGSIDTRNAQLTKDGKAKIGYQGCMQQQLSFLMSNLQSEGQAAILELLVEWVQSHSKQEVEMYSQLLILGAMTVRTNQSYEVKGNYVRDHACDSLVGSVLSLLNNDKIGNLIDKGLTWIDSDRMNSIRLCGSALLRLLVEKEVKLSPGLTKKLTEIMVAKSQIILKQEVEEWHRTKAISGMGGNKKAQGGQKWSKVLSMMDSEVSSSYQYDPSVVEVMSLLTLLLKQNSVKANLEKIIQSLWQLLHVPFAELVEATAHTLDNTKILPSLLSKSINDNPLLFIQQNTFSFKKTVSSMIFNQVPSYIIITLVSQIFQEERNLTPDRLKLLVDCGWFLAGLALKAHNKVTHYQETLPTILQVINQCCLHSQGKDVVMANQQLTKRLVEVTVRLANNQLMGSESRQKLEGTTQLLKESLGAGEYFKLVGEIESKRRERRAEEKVRVAELAITDPQQHALQRGHNRHKKRKL